jgi:hypothetical protein
MIDNLFSFGLEKKNWKRIYCETIDGFSASSFHSKCDNKGTTLVLIFQNQSDIIYH